MVLNLQLKLSKHWESKMKFVYMSREFETAHPRRQNTLTQEDLQI